MLHNIRSIISAFFKSIVARLTLFYTISVLLVLVVSVAFIGAISRQAAINDAGKDMRVGPGYLSLTGEQAVVSGIYDVNIRNVLDEFEPFGCLSVETQRNESGSLVSLTITNCEGDRPGDAAEG